MPIVAIGSEGVRVKSGADVEILTSFGQDWDTVVAAPTERTANLIGGEVRNEDFDLSTLPINALAIITYAWCIFKTSGAGGAAITWSGSAVLLALRDSTGALSVANFGGALVVGTDPSLTVTGVSAPDANTARLQVTNGASTGAWQFRFAIAYRQSPAAVAPP